MKKVLVLVGSNSSASINKKLAVYASTLFTKATVEVFDLKGFDIPIYSPDLQQEIGFPKEISALFDQIQEQDALVIASPEYNGSIPAAFKNVIDWLSRVEMKFLGSKPVILMSTSPGKNGGATNLGNMQPLVAWWGGSVVASHSFGSFHDIYDSESQALTGEAGLKMKELVSALEMYA